MKNQRLEPLQEEIQPNTQSNQNIDCSVCYYMGQKFSNGTENSLNSIWTFRCENGKWVRIRKLTENNTEETEPSEKEVENNDDCKVCYFLNMEYSEGAISGLNTVYTHVCRDGQWNRM